MRTQPQERASFLPALVLTTIMSSLGRFASVLALFMLAVSAANAQSYCTASTIANNLRCNDGTYCNVLTAGWRCCEVRGGRLACPPERPLMCNSRTCDGDNCCDTRAGACASLGGVVPRALCGGVSLAAPAGACPTSGIRFTMRCRDNSTCNVGVSGWNCCSARGGRLACPPEKPLLCSATSSNCAGGNCCDSLRAGCTSKGGFLIVCPALLASTTTEPTTTSENSTLANTTTIPTTAVTLLPTCAASTIANNLRCNDGTYCNVLTAGWRCCEVRGGRLACPPERPLMCNSRTCDGDNCCDTRAGACASLGGVVPRALCGGVSLAAPAGACPTSGIRFTMRCRDNSTCNVGVSGWNCCSARGGRLACPPEKPLLCLATSSNCAGGNCCDSLRAGCTSKGGFLQTCPVPIFGTTTVPTTPYPTCAASTIANNLRCNDGTYCNVLTAGWRCCEVRGGRLACPPERPLMCNSRTCDGDNCCDTRAGACASLGGVVPRALCGGVSLAAPAGACPTSGIRFTMRCRDNSTCNVGVSGWNCCSARGGRLACPPEKPLLCSATSSNCAGGNCCDSLRAGCTSKGGFLQTCPAAGPSLTSTRAATVRTTTRPTTAARCAASTVTNSLRCRNGSYCNVGSGLKWGCCKNAGGRFQCPPERPVMCNSKSCEYAGDYCCDFVTDNCRNKGGVLPLASCPRAL
jgi:hypothetical protein